MPKSKTRKGHQAKVAKRNATKKAEQKALIKEFKSQLAAKESAAKQQDSAKTMNREISRKLAEESKSIELASNELPTNALGIDASKALTDALSTEC